MTSNTWKKARDGNEKNRTMGSFRLAVVFSSLTLLACFAVHAENASDSVDTSSHHIETTMFSVDVPDKWQITKSAESSVPIPKIAESIWGGPGVIWVLGYVAGQSGGPQQSTLESFRMWSQFVPPPFTDRKTQAAVGNMQSMTGDAIPTEERFRIKSLTSNLKNGVTLDDIVYDVPAGDYCLVYRKYSWPSGSSVVYSQITRRPCTAAVQLADGMTSTFHWKTVPAPGAVIPSEVISNLAPPRPHAPDPYPLEQGSVVSARVYTSPVDNAMQVNVQNDGPLDVQAVAFSLTNGEIRYKNTVKQYIPCLAHRPAMKTGEYHIYDLGLPIAIMSRLPIEQLHPYVIATVFTDGSTWGNVSMVEHLKTELAKCQQSR